MEDQFGSQWPLHTLPHFHIENLEKSSYVIESGSYFLVSGSIKNNVQEYATTYIVIKFAHADNQHAHVAFDTDRDFSDGEKEALRIVDIPPLGTKQFCVQVGFPEDLERQTLDMRIELWSPARKTWRKSPPETIALFYRSDWGNSIDVIRKEDLVATAFVSYAWISDEHIKWVNQLTQELARRQIKVILDRRDLAPGLSITRFMETGTRLPVCLCICSTAYTEKANGENGSGVSYETSMLSQQILQGRLRSTIIPVFKDNPEKRLPDFLGSARGIDMDHEQWQGLPLTELAIAIKNASKIKKPDA